MILTKGMFIDLRESEFQPKKVHQHLLDCGNKFYTKTIIFDHTKSVIEWTEKGLVVNSKNLFESTKDVTPIIDGGIRYEDFVNAVPDKFVCRASAINIIWLSLRGVRLANGNSLMDIELNKISKIAVKNKIAYISSSNKMCSKFPAYSLIALDFVRQIYYIKSRKIKQGK